MIGYVALYMVTSHFAHIDVSEEDNSHREESVDAGHGVRVETAIKFISFRYVSCQNYWIRHSKYSVTLKKLDMLLYHINMKSEIEKFSKSEHKEMLQV